MALKQPVGQKRLTNIAIVKLKSHGLRFEIACYKNKVMNWRDGVEKDIDEVLQTTSIFSNVGKGIWAKEADLKKVFGTVDENVICRQILEKGELQVSDKEREAHLESLYKDVATIVSEKCINPDTGLPVTVSIVERALREVHFQVRPGVPAKKQALKAIEVLETHHAGRIARAPMRLRITCPKELASEVLEHVAKASAKVESEQHGAELVMLFTCDPSHYRTLDTLITGFKNPHAHLQVINQVVTRADAVSNTISMDMKNLSIDSEATRARERVLKPAVQTTTITAPKMPTCSTCAWDAPSVQEYRAHCKSERHNYNLKRKVKGLPPVSQLEFEEVCLDMAQGFMAVD